MKKVRISISTISIICLLVLTSIVFCFFGYLYYNRQRDAHLSALYSTLRTTANQLSRGLSIAVWNFDEAQVAGILESGMLDRNIDAIVIEYNDRGKTAMSITRNGSGGFRIDKKKIVAPANTIRIENDVIYSGDTVGKLTVFGTTERVYANFKKDVALIALFILLLIMVMFAGLYCIFYFIVIEPLKFLEQFSLSITPGKLDTGTISRKRYFREVDNLSESLQKMISSLNESYRKLEASERRYKETVSLLPMCVFELNLDGYFTFINEAGLRLFDFTREEMAEGIRFSSRISHKNLRTAFDNRNRLMAGTKPVEKGTEYLIRKKDGTYIPMMYYSSQITEDGVVVGIRGVGVDLTEQKQNEEALNELLRLDFIKEKESEKQKTLSLIEGQEKERLRISREIHDGIGQMMTAIKLSTDSIDPEYMGSDHNEEKLHYTKILIQDIIAELRQVSSDLSPTFLYDYGLYSAVNQLVVNVSKITDMEILLSSNVQKVRFHSNVETTLYRIVQETMNNTLKYSEAKNMKINLIMDAEFLELTMEDDGIGCDLLALKAKDGSGLKNISLRASLIGANLSITSEPGKGFQVSIQVPIGNIEREGGIPER